MDNIPDDIYLNICTWLPDTTKLTYLSTSKHTNRLKNKLRFTECVNIERIINHPRYDFDNFTNVNYQNLLGTYKQHLVIVSIKILTDIFQTLLQI